MRIVIPADSLLSWSGGSDLLRVLIRGLAVKKNHELILFVKGSSRVPAFIEKLIRPLLKKWYRRFKPAAPCGLEDLSNTVQIFPYFYKDDLLRYLNPDVLFPVMTSSGFERSVGYLYDCQHKHYPEFFADAEIQARDKSFRTLLGQSKAAVVTSEDAKSDLLEFYPQTNCEIVALPFAPTLGVSWLEEQTERLEKYSLPKKYFVISNQFWIHKNHIVAFEALEELCKSGEDMVLVCTGKMTDSRAPEHTNDLIKWIAEKQLEKRILLLGYIDKRDQIEILKNAVAVIQPTLFEGLPGGLSMADALSLGCRVIVSDLPVNRELPQGKTVRYFPPRNSHALAVQMREVWEESYERPSDEELLEQEQLGLRRLSDALYDAIEKARR